MTHAAKIVCDSISPDGVRLTSMEIVFPRIILAEFNTHRMLSRNSASSRAIPIEKMLKMVQDHPYVPIDWGKNQKGMQAEELVGPQTAQLAEEAWLHARDTAVSAATRLLDLGIHKQTTNRLLEPFMWHTVLVTSTDWSNYFNLRTHKDAHPDIQRVSRLMKEVHESSTPIEIGYGGWHRPYIRDTDILEAARMVNNDAALTVETLNRVSIGRCARLSYLTHDGRRDLAEDVGLHGRMLSGGHMSPFEHVATPMLRSGAGEMLTDVLNKVLNGSLFGEDSKQEIKYTSSDPASTYLGNFRGWVQARKLIANESDILAA